MSLLPRCRCCPAALPRCLAAWLPACGLAADAVLFRQAGRRKPAATPYRFTPYYLWTYSRPPLRS